MIKLEDKDYFGRKEISNSDITHFRENGLNAFLKSKYLGIKQQVGRQESFDFGTLCHMLILEPERVENGVAVFNGEGPSSENERRFADLILDGCFAEEAYVRCYSTKSKAPQIITKEANERLEKLLPYINTLTDKRNGKLVVSGTDWANANKLVEAYKSNPLVEKLFKVSDNCEHYTETAIFWEELDLNLKLKFDELIIDHDKKLIILNDVKTSQEGTVAGFRKSVQKYGYDTQAAHYKRGILSIPEIAELQDKKNYEFKNYITLLDKVNLTCRVLEFSKDTLTTGYWKRESALRELRKFLDKIDTNNLTENTYIVEDYFKELPEEI